jgi:hypothetical protein
MRSTRDDSRDTGLAIVLLLLLLHMGLGRPWLVTAAVAVLAVTMTAPRLLAPAAVVWLGVAHHLGRVMSTVLLTAVFALVIVPIGVVRRWLGKDSLQLRAFKAGSGSVMRVRRHTCAAADLDKPY